MIKIFRTMPGGSVEVMGDTQMAVIQELNFWESLPALCPFEGCGQPLHFFYKRAQEKYDYYGLRCENEPAHECNFGQRTDHSGLYYKGPESFDTEYKAQQQRANGNGGQQQPQQQSAPPPQGQPPQSSDPKEKVARALVASKLVSRLPNGDYNVRQGTQDYIVRRGNDQKIYCSGECPQPCVHRLAVKFFVAVFVAEPQAAPAVENY